MNIHVQPMIKPQNGNQCLNIIMFQLTEVLYLDTTITLFTMFHFCELNDA